MLTINKSTTLSATSTINGNQVVYMNAVINTNGNNNENITKSIANQELYKNNRDEVRADMAAFEQEVYKIQDEMLGGAVSEA